MPQAFIMPDNDHDLTTEEGRKQQQRDIAAAARRYSFKLVPAGGAKGGIGKGRIAHNDRIHNIK